MKLLSISWNSNTDVTKITYSKDFEESSWIVKLDTLIDAINMLTDKYNSYLTPDRERNEII